MAKGNRNLRAKFELSVQQRIEAGWMEYSKDCYRRSTRVQWDKPDRMAKTVEVLKADINEAGTLSRIARAKAHLASCQRVERSYKGRRVLQAI